MQPITPSPYFSLACNWWAFALRGLMAMAFGALALALPMATVLLITLGFGVYACADGLLTLIAGLRRARRGEAWRWMVLAGLLGIAAGILALAWPPSASLALIAFIWSIMALWTLAVGALELATSARLRRTVKGGWLLGLRGVIALLLGLGLFILMVCFPLASLVSLGWMVGLASFLSGLALMALAHRLRHMGQEDAPTRPTAASTRQSS